MIILIGVLGAWAGMALGARTHTAIGPADVTLSLRGSVHGGTVVDIAPLGTLRLDTHRGPIQLVADVDQIRLPAARKLIEHPHQVTHLTDRISDEVRHALIKLVIRSVVIAVVAAALAGLLVFRRPARVAWTALAALVTCLVMVATAALTFNGRALAEPKYTGLLSAAPALVGNADDIVHRFSKYRQELAQLVGNVSQIYATLSDLPVYGPDAETIRILHVSDIHLNPAAWNIMHSLVKQFRVQAIVDTGDMTDHGSHTENAFVKKIGSFTVPYVFIKGNHDSLDTERAVAKQHNAVVLDDDFKTVKGIRFFGVGDPRFTPDKSVVHPEGNQKLITLGRQFAHEVAARKQPTDVVLTHDPVEGQMFSGTVPLILAGHLHRREAMMLPTGSRLLVEGSTGGAGVRALDHDKPTPVDCSVLYFDKKTHRLQARDDITVGGLGESSASIDRHVVPNPNRTIHPTPSPTPSGTEATTVSPTG